MNLEDYQKTIVNTTKDDWTLITCWGAGSGPSYLNNIIVWNTGAGKLENIDVDSHSNVISLKDDLSISVAWGITHNNDFVEDWANNFPDSHAQSQFVDFFYNGQLVFRDIGVVIDGGRCNIPLPQIIFNTNTSKIEKFVVPVVKYKFFKLLNALESTTDYERYFQRTGIEIVEEKWIY